MKIKYIRKAGFAYKELGRHHSILTTSKAELDWKINNSWVRKREEDRGETAAPKTGETE